MSLTLTNDLLIVTVETAGEKYCGSRFDWNGTVTGINYKNISILSAEKLPALEDIKFHGRGLHNEFGIKNCIGYDEINVGEWFPKIGTGWLKKDDEPYFFYKNYEIDPLDFSYTQESDTKVVFTCVSGERNGYSYKYTKTITLEDSKINISYKLENLGTKKIETTEYIHNFLLPGAKPVNTHLKLTFPWNYKIEDLVENVKTDNLVKFEEKGITFIKNPDVEYFLGGIYQEKNAMSSTASWSLYDAENDITVSETGSFPLYNCDVWGHGNVISPELFYFFSVEPGKEISWSRTYEFKG
ncbi:MAG: hypothetical protein IKZ04_05525 [Spirochaetaceae bacterium]|nr:hypothetical protein [Spirochaetaceae bacterium]